jgi:hypothetical protein
MVIEDRRTGERARYEAVLVLVRPDQFVAWTSSNGEVDPQAILKRVRGFGTMTVPSVLVRSAATKSQRIS